MYVKTNEITLTLLWNVYQADYDRIEGENPVGCGVLCISQWLGAFSLISQNVQE